MSLDPSIICRSLDLTHWAALMFAVAAVAGFVWTLNPNYSPADVRDRIRATVRTNGNWTGYVSTGGILDAAAAVGASCGKLRTEGDR